MRGTACLLVVMAGCLNKPRPPAATGDGGPTIDGTPPCTWSTWSIPTPLPGPVQSTADDWAPTPTEGELVLVFSSYRNGSDADLFGATRADRGSAFSAAAPLVQLDTSDNEKVATLTEDGLFIVLERDDAATGNRLWSASRTMNTATFSAAVVLPVVNAANPYSDIDPWISADGTRLVFASDRTNNNKEMDLLEATRSGTSEDFTLPTPLGPLESTDNDVSPTLSADGLDIYFASQRTGGPGDFDVYTAHRPRVESDFGPPVLVPELSSSMDDTGLRLSNDGATMYLNYDSDTNGGQNAQLWFSTRTCK